MEHAWLGTHIFIDFGIRLYTATFFALCCFLCNTAFIIAITENSTLQNVMSSKKWSQSNVETELPRAVTEGVPRMDSFVSLKYLALLMVTM